MNLEKDAYRSFIFARTYSRFRDEFGRRETWEEAVDRYMSFMLGILGEKLSQKDYNDIRQAILNQDVMPSMRLLWSAGDAASKTNATAYNCSYIAPTCWQDFGEILYLLTCGSGVGFSVEKKFVDQLPEIKEQTGEKLKTMVIPDSREGWADSIATGLKTWASGKDIEFDYSKIRPAGARLKTMGGRASGPEPLVSLLTFAREKMLARQGKRLRTIDVHDIICKIGEVVVAGGVRRSSEISLSDLGDEDMRDAKKGAFYYNEPQRSMSNNSAVYEEKPTLSEFLREWTSLIESGSGERGIFNRAGLHTQMPERRSRDHVDSMGTNPCGEITLRSKQFCNLTEVVARPTDTGLRLLEKVRLATIMGTFQSMLTDFNYLSKDWKKNCEEERLLGVSITGQWDCKLTQNRETLEMMREHAVKTNKRYAKKFGINPSASITTVKPSGTVSQLVDASSGMHPRFAPYYIRRVRISATDPLFKLLRDQGIPHHPEVGQDVDNPYTYVLEFPIKAPKGSKTASETTAIDQLEHWKMVKEAYTEHNPSNTIYVKDEEWLEVGAWLLRNWDIVGGLSFLPKTNHVYELAPYEEITEEKYNELKKAMPKLDFTKLSEYEKEDNTEKPLACEGATCTIT